jgi:hypothetical protein
MTSEVTGADVNFQHRPHSDSPDGSHNGETDKTPAVWYQFCKQTRIYIRIVLKEENSTVPLAWVDEYWSTGSMSQIHDRYLSSTQ